MMSVMENSSAPNPACTVVHMEPADILSLAGQFVVQYYTFLRKCPSGIHRFYKDDSSMIREDAPVFGQRMIHDKIMSMNLQDTRVAILRLDALRANGNSVLIQVAGEISANREKFRRFTQSFILREQAPCDFYVLNDIFRYQDHVYGDVLTNDAEPDSAEANDISRKHTDFGTGDCSSHISLQHQDPEPDRLEHITTWENSSTDETYKHGTVEAHDNKLDQCEVNQIPAEHSAPSPCPSNVVSSPVPDPSQQNAPTSTQSRSWAQMASKPPSQTALNMQTIKAVRNVPNAPDYQLSEEHMKSTRQQSGTSHFGNQRPRGMGGRQQQSEGRGVSGDGIFNQDNRMSGQGPMRGGGQMRGAPRGPRGGGRGMGNGPTMGRGGSANNMGQRRS